MKTEVKSSDLDITEIEDILRSVSRRQAEQSIERLIGQGRLAVSRLLRSEHYHRLMGLVGHG